MSVFFHPDFDKTLGQELPSQSPLNEALRQEVLKNLLEFDMLILKSPSKKRDVAIGKKREIFKKKIPQLYDMGPFKNTKDWLIYHQHPGRMLVFLDYAYASISSIIPEIQGDLVHFQNITSDLLIRQTCAQVLHWWGLCQG